MLRVNLLGRYVVKSTGSGAPTRVALSPPTRTAWAFFVRRHTFSGDARNPGAAAREPLHRHPHQVTVLQRASHEHGIASHSTTRQQHITRGGKTSPSSSSARSIHALGRRKKWNDALQIFRSIEEPTALEVRALLGTMAYNHQPQHAMIALRQLQGSGAVTFHDYELAIHAHAKELPLVALELLHKMEREGFGWTLRARGTVLQALGKDGRLNAALHLIDEMEQRNFSPTDLDYLVLIVACARGKSGMRAGDRGGSEQALEFLQRMQDKGPVPDIRHYNAAMKVCVTKGDSAKAISMFQSARDQGMQPNIRSWGALLDAIGKAGQVAEMMAWYGEMLAIGGVLPDLVIMTTLLDNAGKAGEVRIAEGIWSETRDRQLAPNNRTYNALINCYATARQPDKAEGVLAEMVQSAAVKPDAISFNRCVKLCMAVHLTAYGPIAVQEQRSHFIC
ncbi:hypothetical protein JKP88DRAFT_176600 [Tribonema minus]|uniref:PROP1-like PPR domain-containing protein n=1 Tax=Tribonema minus TaxID=303371 RepID=A0A835Z1B2_9STRA|nr:hypothetical protein JKP88DRAFT_181295 [Tribonema minus]KAG5189784.1 hypothetical protein JKP88DRAFT_176600 [Tribonema minus]